MPGYRPVWSDPEAEGRSRLGLDIEPAGGVATALPGLTREDNSFLEALGDESNVCVGLRSRPPGLQRISAEAAPCDIGTEDRSDACFGEASSQRDLSEKDQLPSSASWTQFVPGAQGHGGDGEDYTEVFAEVQDFSVSLPDFTWDSGWSGKAFSAIGYFL